MLELDWQLKLILLFILLEVAMDNASVCFVANF